jgi:hypothetical protein
MAISRRNSAKTSTASKAKTGTKKAASKATTKKAASNRKTKSLPSKGVGLKKKEKEEPITGNTWALAQAELEELKFLLARKDKETEDLSSALDKAREELKTNQAFLAKANSQSIKAEKALETLEHLGARERHASFLDEKLFPTSADPEWHGCVALIHDYDVDAKGNIELDEERAIYVYVTHVGENTLRQKGDTNTKLKHYARKGHLAVYRDKGEKEGVVTGIVDFLTAEELEDLLAPDDTEHVFGEGMLELEDI